MRHTLSSERIEQVADHYAKQRSLKNCNLRTVDEDLEMYLAERDKIIDYLIKRNSEINQEQS